MTMNVFNEKIVAVLEFNDKKDTRVLASAVTQTWNC